VTELLTAVCLV